MDIEYTFATGLALFIIGISFLCNRIYFIKKGNVALATLCKLEACIDSDNDIYYIPYFKFTTHDQKEITYKFDSLEWNAKWSLGEKVKVVYREELFDNHEILLLTISNVFGLSIILLTLGILFLIIAGGLYWNISGKTLAWLIPASIVFFIVALYLRTDRFFNSLKHP
jgi:hypothetical protein